ncbi:MAG: NifB/NifX family molybdenum-iron cluster-binding protein [Candidatus Lernaella stagnicola]|nr:NifB/NifX family molybdenum-iron cluster-binding protein [Candidatus Lernaella stagnicola]
MKIALTVWGNRISPVFDAARQVLVVDIEQGVVVSRHVASLGTELPHTRALRLSGWGVQSLVCGAISREFAQTLEFHGIQVIPFITGEVNQVLDAYLRGALAAGGFRMAGTGARRRKRFRGGSL